MAGRPGPRCAVLLMALLLLVPTALDAALADATGGDRDGTRSGGTWTLDRYHMWDEVLPELQSLVSNNSDIAVLHDLGKLYPNGDGSTKTSLEGRHFWAVKVSDNPELEEEDEPNVLYVGMHHAREWMNTEMMFYLLTRILNDYGTNATITNLVDTRELWFWPILNPDGFVYSQVERMWRKNRRDNGDGTFGVDPNRNYGNAWAYDDTGSSPDTNSETYRGPAPFSEPCTQVMRDLAYDKRFAGAISFHTWQDVIIFPISHVREHAPHYPILKELGRLMAAHNGYDYGDVRDGILYTVNGGWDDFMYFNTSTICFTFEMNSAADGRFDPPPSLIAETVMENYEPALLLAVYAHDYYTMFSSGIKAQVVDPRGNPLRNVSVQVELLGDDELDFTTGADGRFTFLAPYERYYRITAELEGHSTYNESVQVMWRDRLTDLTIELKDNVPPVISRVEASHDGEVGNSFGIGHQVRIDVFEADDEPGLEGVVTIQSVPAQYFHRRKSLTWDGDTGSYFYLWNTTGLKPGSGYLVTTELWDIDGNKDNDGLVRGEPDLKLTLRDITPPKVPINLTVEGPSEGSSLRVSWEANQDDTQAYTLERREGALGTWTLLINLTREDTEFLDRGLENGMTYYYRLMAWDAVPLPSGWSDVALGIPKDLVPPGEVTGLKAMAPQEGGELELSWQESTDDVAVYVLYRDDGPGLVPIAELPRGTTTYNDVGLENKKAYMYKVMAVDASGNEGPLSPGVMGIPLDTIAPAMPDVSALPELTNLSEHQVSGTAEPRSTVLAVVNQETVAQLAVGEDGAFSGTLPLSSGVNRVRFRAMDPSENQSPFTPEVIVQVDLRAPLVTSSQPLPDQREVDVNAYVEAIVSEALLEVSVGGRLVLDESGVLVPSSVDYDPVAKRIKLYPSKKLERGLRYRVELSGSDFAGNALAGGTFVFTTQQPDEPEPAISSSMMMVILVVLVLAAVGALLVLRARSRGPEEGTVNGPSGGYPGSGPPREGFDTPGHDEGEQLPGRDWEEY